MYVQDCVFQPHNKNSQRIYKMKRNETESEKVKL